MDLTYLQDSGFWIAQIAFGCLFMFTRFPNDFIQWRVNRAVRKALRQLEVCAAGNDEVLARRVTELEIDFVEAPRLLRPFYAFSIIREAKRVRAAAERPAEPPTSSDQDDSMAPTDTPLGSTGTANQTGPTTVTAPIESEGPTLLRQQTDEEGSPVSDTAREELLAVTNQKPSAPSVALPPRRLATAVSALCRHLTALAAHIVGGAEGLDYLAETTRDLADVKKTATKLAYATSNLIGAVKLRLVLRTIPFLKDLTTASIRLWPRQVCTLIDCVVASNVMSGMAAGLIDGVLLITTNVWINSAYILWAAIPLVPISCHGLARARTGWRSLRSRQRSET